MVNDLYSAVLVPVGCAVLSSLITILGGVWAVSRTDFYRRLSRWDPYRKALWDRRVELCGRVGVAVNHAVNAVMILPALDLRSQSHSHPPTDEERQHAFIGVLEAVKELNALIGETNLFFTQRMQRAALEFVVAIGDMQRRYLLVQTTPNDWHSAVAKQLAFTNVIRQEMGVDALDAETISALKEMADASIAVIPDAAADRTPSH